MKYRSYAFMLAANAVLIVFNIHAIFVEEKDAVVYIQYLALFFGLWSFFIYKFLLSRLP